MCAVWLVYCVMIVSCVIADDGEQRVFAISHDLDFLYFVKKSVAVCHYQDDVEACKSVHVVGYANPNPTELFRLATLFITSHLVFFGSVPYLQHEEIFGIVSSYCNPLC